MKFNMLSLWSKPVPFDPSQDIPDLSGRIIFITGASDGLGYETVLQLASHRPGHIYLASRNAEKTAAAISRIVEHVRAATGDDVSSKLTHIALDLTSFASIKGAAQTFLAKESTLNVLMNNAGIMCVPAATTKQGYEVQFGVNHMGHALLTRLLLPALKKAVSVGQDARVVTLASSSERQAPRVGLRLDAAKTDMAEFDNWERYGQSKLANVLYTRTLAEKCPEITFVSLHPGVVRTGISSTFLASRSWQIPFVCLIMWTQWVTPYEGAWLQEWLATTEKET
ncbi:NAD(P)-binding protein [Westerdykella ornata]|uniref:NAD(P)-binding protein n=1 Tax=Westerdykella ornata TaxID=318751 RepID=A0A6A6J492_WESOR|nr:NAD(P)-binding protein [Westerdykella ornata]KAF2271255.1 NAD(P)-binding protein [Westerdykella ornata]